MRKDHLEASVFYQFAVSLFQAQIEIQSVMEENTYPLFLKSDLYLEYTRTGGESPKPNPSDQSPSSGPVKPVPGYLPTLAEDEEWRSEDEPPLPPRIKKKKNHSGPFFFLCTSET